MNKFKPVSIEDVITNPIIERNRREIFRELKYKNYAEYKKIVRLLEQTNYRENYTCSNYLGIYIERYVQMVFNAEPVPSKGSHNEKRPVDWIVDWKGEKLKVKHISSRLIFQNGHLCWYYTIIHNEEVDAFILSAFGDSEFEPEHIWFIKAKDMFKTSRTEREFWNRSDLRIFDFKRVISKMCKYELKKELKQLKDIMVKVKSERKLKEDKNDVYSLITKKQEEIFIATRNKESRKYIIEKAIMAGIDKIEY